MQPDAPRLLIGHPRASPQLELRRVKPMLFTIAVILIVLWALGLATAYTLSGYIHILLLIAIAVILIRVIQGRRLV
jgi:hypothetical protein